MAQDYLKFGANLIDHPAYEISGLPDLQQNVQVQRDRSGRFTTYYKYDTSELTITWFGLSYNLEQYLWGLYDYSCNQGNALVLYPEPVNNSGVSYTGFITGNFDCTELENQHYNLTITFSVQRIDETITSEIYNLTPSDDYLKEIGYYLGDTGQGKRIGIRPRHKVFVNRSLWIDDPSTDTGCVDLTDPYATTAGIDAVLSIGQINVKTDFETGKTTASDTTITLSNETAAYDVYFDYLQIVSPPANPTWIGKDIQVWTGVRYSSGVIEYIPRFTGTIAGEAEFDNTARTVSIHCLDRIEHAVNQPIGNNLLKGLTVKYYNSDSGAFAAVDADWSGTSPIATEDGKTMDTQQFLWGANKPHPDIDSVNAYAVEISGYMLIDNPGQQYKFEIIKETSDNTDNYGLWVQDAAITYGSAEYLPSSWPTDIGTFTFADSGTAKRFVYFSLRYTTANGAATARKIYIQFYTDGIPKRALEGYTFSKVDFDTYAIAPQFYDNTNPAAVILARLKYVFAKNAGLSVLTEAALTGASTDAQSIWHYVNETSYNLFYSDCDSLGLYITDWINEEENAFDKINIILKGISGTLYSRGDGKIYFRLYCPRINTDYIPTFKDDKNIISINYSVSCENIKNIIKLSYNRDFYNDKMLKNYIAVDTASIATYKRAGEYSVELGVINDDATIQVLADQIKDRLKDAYPVYTFQGTLSLMPLYVKDRVKIIYDKAGTSTSVNCEISELTYDIINNTISGVAVVDFFDATNYAICGDETTTEAQGYGVFRDSGVQYNFF